MDHAPVQMEDHPPRGVVSIKSASSQMDPILIFKLTFDLPNLATLDRRGGLCYDGVAANHRIRG